METCKITICADLLKFRFPPQVEIECYIFFIFMFFIYLRAIRLYIFLIFIFFVFKDKFYLIILLLCIIWQRQPAACPNCQLSLAADEEGPLLSCEKKIYIYWPSGISAMLWYIALVFGS